MDPDAVIRQIVDDLELLESLMEENVGLYPIEDVLADIKYNLSALFKWKMDGGFDPNWQKGLKLLNE